MAPRTLRVLASTLVAVSLSLAGCRRSTPAPVDLRARWIPGQYACSGSTSVESHTVLEGPPGQSTTETSVTRMDVRLSVAEPDARGAKLVTMRFTRVVEDAGGRHHDTDVVQGPIPGWEQYPVLVRLEFQARVEPDGRLVEDADDLAGKLGGKLEKVVAELERVDRRTGARMRAEMSKLRAIPFLQTPITASYGRRPALHGVSEVGESWSDSQRMDLPLLGPATFRGTFRLEAVEPEPEGAVARISFTQVMEGAASGAPIDLPGGGKLTFRAADCQGKGRFSVPVANDLLTGSDLEIVFTGDAEVRAPGGSMRMQMTQRTTSTSRCVRER